MWKTNSGNIKKAISSPNLLNINNINNNINKPNKGSGAGAEDIISGENSPSIKTMAISTPLGVVDKPKPVIVVEDNITDATTTATGVEVSYLQATDKLVMEPPKYYYKSDLKARDELLVRLYIYISIIILYIYLYYERYTVNTLLYYGSL